MTLSRRRAMTWTLVALGAVIIVLMGLLGHRASPRGWHGYPYHRGFVPGGLGGGLGGWLIAAFVALRLVVIAFLALLVARVVTALRGSTDSALQTANRRFAAGEITEEELRRIREVLRS